MNQEIEIKFFKSSEQVRVFNEDDKKKISNLIREEIIPKADGEYISVIVKINRTEYSTPESLIIYMLRKDTYYAEVKKVFVDKNYRIQEIYDDYDDSEEENDNEDEEEGFYDLGEEYVDFVIATPLPQIPTANLAVNKVYELAMKVNRTAKVLLGPDANVSNYKKYLRMGLEGFVNIGHGRPTGITVDDGFLSNKWFDSLPSKVLSKTHIYFNSCEVFNTPLLSSIKNAGVRAFIGGIKKLKIGPSEEVCKCFWDRYFNPRHQALEFALDWSEYTHYIAEHHHGIYVRP